jgi:hypothetical protein
MGFQENLAVLPTVDSLARIELAGPDGKPDVIENRPGSQGSLRIYQHLALKYGEIDAAAAAEGLALYAEHRVDALAHPGKHPNIDRLLDVMARDMHLAVRLIASIP